MLYVSVAIVIPYIKGEKEDDWSPLCMVLCEHPLHKGNRLRIVRKSYAIKDKCGHLCFPCRLLGIKRSAEIVEKTASKLRGYKHTEQAKKNMSLGKRGQIFSLEHKINLSKAQTGKRQSKETIEKRKKSLPRGEKHHAWVKEKTPEDRALDKRRGRHVPEFRTWSEHVKQRDNYTCQISGKIGGELTSHHLNGWKNFPEQRFDISNGITISEQYHDLFHRIYGKGNNTKEQFDDFLTYCKGNDNSYIEL